MTDSDLDLLAAITADPTAKALADAGNDAGCAARMVAILPPIQATNLVTERGLYAAFGNPADAEAILAGLTQIGQTNPVVARARTWLAPSEGGLDMGHPSTVAELAALAVSAPTVFTAARMAVLTALGKSQPRVSAEDVSRVYMIHRPNGLVT